MSGLSDLVLMGDGEKARALALEQLARLERVESMLIYLLETTAAEQVVKPNLEQAKALQAMGQPPRPTIKRDTNKFEIWHASWQALQVRATTRACHLQILAPG